MTAALFGCLAAAAMATILAAPAAAEDSPSPTSDQDRPAPPVAPAESPKENTPAPSLPPQDTPKGDTPAPSLPPQDAPGREPAVPPLDGPAGAPGGQPDSRKQAAPGPGAQQQDAADQTALSMRYRFLERYSVAPDPKHPEALTQYRVANRDTWKIVREKLQATPERTQETVQTIYTERVARASRLGLATEVVRRYDTVRTSRNSIRAPAMKPPILEGLKVLYRRQAKQNPEVLSLVDNRPLRDAEYTVISGELFLPQLTELLPRTPLRVDDTWDIPREVAASFWVEPPDVAGYELVGSLVKVEPGPGSSLVAVIAIQGQFFLQGLPSAFNAEIDFQFELPKPDPAAAAPAAATTKDAPGSPGPARPKSHPEFVEARGWITQALMSLVKVQAVADESGRLKQTTTRELHVERRLMPAQPGATAGSVPPVDLPNPLPVATEANSWLVYNDPAGRFHVRHPQELELIGSGPEGAEFKNSRLPGSSDTLVIFLKPRREDADGTEAFRDPAQLQRMIEAGWATLKLEATRGPSGWLPQAAWKPFNRRVWRTEAAVKPTEGAAGNDTRLYTDDYLVVLPTSRTVVFHSMTERNDHIVFRKQVESMIQSFQFGSPEPRATAPPVSPSSNPSGVR